MPTDLVASLSDLATKQNLKMHPYFLVSSTDTIVISQDDDNPTPITGLANMDGSFGFTLRSSDGAVQNTIGRDIGAIAGSLTFQLDKIGGGTPVLSVWSQRSADGVTWIDLAGGLRQEEVGGTNESFSTKASFTGSWPSGEWIRFVCSTTTALTIKASSLTKTSGTITGQSVVWWLKEL